MDNYMFSGFIAVIVLIGFVAAIVYWTHRRSNELLEDWAKQNDYQILSAEMRWFRKGPFVWTTGRGQTVYYIEVIDPSQGRRSGWVRCGSFWLGLWSKRVEVQWEDVIEA